MADQTTRSPRRRPVDALFGEDVDLSPKPVVADSDTKQASPGYMVEPPRPVNSVRPPPPEFPNDWRVNAPPEPVTVLETPVEMVTAASDVIQPPPKPANAEPPVVVETIAEAVTFTTTVEPPRETAPASPAPAKSSAATAAPVSVAPVITQAPVAAAPPMYGQAELVELSQFVDQLYQNVADETSDSAKLNAECLANLNAARIAIERHDYAKAEASAELVKARLLRARSSRTAAAQSGTRALYGWLVVATLLGIVLFAIPLFIPRLVPALIPLLRGAGLGMLGGAAIALFQLSRSISAREFDGSFTTRFALSPLFGTLIGAVMYLLSLLGILAAPNALGFTAEPFLLMYLFALLGGIFNDAIVYGIRGLIVRPKT